MFSRITPVTAGAFAALAALIVGFAVALADEPPFVQPLAPSPDLRVDMSCVPLTNSQSVTAGDPQKCTIRIRNYSLVPIENVTFDRPTPNTITARYSKGWKSVPCTLAGCDSFTLGARETVYIVEESTFNPSLDGRGLTTATAYGERPGVTLIASGREQKSLP